MRNMDQGQKGFTSIKLLVVAVVIVVVAVGLAVNLFGEEEDVVDDTLEFDYTVSNPIEAVQVVNIATGQQHSLLLTDGKVYAFGGNTDGQLGDGTTLDRHTPVMVEGLEGIEVIAVAAGDRHSMALSADGKVYTWGRNNQGQIGDGTIMHRYTPMLVRALEDVEMVAIAAGNEHSVALSVDGKIYAWGSNTSGQLGDGTRDNDLSIATVQGLEDINVVAIAAGGVHTLALSDDGKVYAWGYNYHGQVGDGTNAIHRTSPLLVEGLSNREIVAIAAGTRHSMALDIYGRVYAWGSNDSGQLGDGTAKDRYKPVTVQGLEGIDIISISTGTVFSMALGMDGKLYAWGRNSDGQLGDGTDIQRELPVLVQGLDGMKVAGIAQGLSSYHSLAIMDTGQIYIWGGNYQGQIGDGTTENRPLPVEVLLP